MNTFKVKDIALSKSGILQVEWAKRHMPVLNQIRERFEINKPLTKMRIGACLHVTKETAVLVETLVAGGAKITICGSNPSTTQDDVAAALASKGTEIYAWREQTTEDYYWCIEKTIENKPNITLDDGADLVGIIHEKHKETLKEIKGGTEETTTGVLRLRAMEKEEKLEYPIIAVNDAYTKHLFDNRFGTGQSTIEGVLRAANIMLAGKNFVVCGYGWCGKGIAMRAKGMGCNVIITEINPLRALEAVMNGYRLMPLLEAATIGDIFVTATGNINVIRKEHFQKMKDGAILANSGHFNVEINLGELAELSHSKREIRENLEEFELQNFKKIYLLAKGRLVNLTAAEGHPAEVMDMSFANQALSVEYIVKNQKLPSKVYSVPKEIDDLIATLKLTSMNKKIDQLTKEQHLYLETWKKGTI